MKRTVATALAASLAAATTATSLADDGASEGILPVPDYTGDVWQRTRLTGDWGGKRTELANKGVQAEVDWTQYGQSVVEGGIDRTSVYGGHLDYLFKIDLMRMGVVPGAVVTVRGESVYGNSVNGDSGAILPVNTTAAFPLTSTLDGDVAITVTELNYTQFLSPQFAVVVGKLQTLDADPNEFASGRGKSQFMDANFIFDPSVALRLPYSTLGVAAVWLPSPNVTVNASVVNTADSSTSSGFDDFGDGVTISAEADLQYRLGELPGGVNVGGLYSFDQDFAEIRGRLVLRPGQGLTIPTEDSTWALYVSGWQYVYVEDPDDKPIAAGDGRPDHQGFGVFTRIGIADQDTNPVEWSASVGVGGRGVIPSRDEDTFGVGYFYTRLQEARFAAVLGVGDEAQGFEAFYNLAITPAARLTFDVQVQDSALPDVDTAIILGLRLNLTF